MVNDNDILLKRIDELETRYNLTEIEFHKERQVLKQTTRRLRVMGSLAVLMCIGALLVSPGNKAIAQGYGESLRQLMADVSTLKTEMSSVQTKTQFMSVSGNTTLFTACNVQIENGMGSTDGETPGIPPLTPPYFTNGLGNLIIGYNQYKGQPENGSHNLILGDGNGYTSFGGIVAGYGNLITGPYASVTGGSGNEADGFFSSVTGGENSKATDDNTSVNGGYSNLASGIDSSVSGGGNNTASSYNSSISGGQSNHASGTYSAIVGGQNNVTSGSSSTISGGYFNSATGDLSSVSGGNSNESRGLCSSIAGGLSNISPGTDSSCLGGYLCRSDDIYSAVLGGYNSTLDTGNSFTHFP